MANNNPLEGRFELGDFELQSGKVLGLSGFPNAILWPFGVFRE